jgi:hypothetical protein
MHKTQQEEMLNAEHGMLNWADLDSAFSLQHFFCLLGFVHLWPRKIDI